MSDFIITDPVSCKQEAMYCFEEQYKDDLEFFLEKLSESVRAGQFFITLTDKNLENYTKEDVTQGFLESLLIYLQLKGFKVKGIQQGLDTVFRIGWDLGVEE